MPPRGRRELPLIFLESMWLELLNELFKWAITKTLPTHKRFLWNCVGGLKTRSCILGGRLMYENGAFTMTNSLKQKNYCHNFLMDRYQLILKNWNYCVILSYYVMAGRKPNFWRTWNSLTGNYLCIRKLTLKLFAQKSLFLENQK